LGSIKAGWISWLDEWILASQEGLCSKQLVPQNREGMELSGPNQVFVEAESRYHKE
jgi:hypothetical protein